MSIVGGRRALWALFCLTIPVPMWFIGPGQVPALALLQISAFMGALMLAEPGPGVWTAVWAIGLQGLFWAAVLYPIARLAASVLARVGDGRVPLAAVAAVAVVLIGLSLFDIYGARIIARGGPVNLFGVY